MGVQLPESVRNQLNIIESAGFPFPCVAETRRLARMHRLAVRVKQALKSRYPQVRDCYFYLFDDSETAVGYGFFLNLHEGHVIGLRESFFSDGYDEDTAAQLVLHELAHLLQPQDDAGKGGLLPHNEKYVDVLCQLTRIYNKRYGKKLTVEQSWIE